MLVNCKTERPMLSSEVFLFGRRKRPVWPMGLMFGLNWFDGYHLSNHRKKEGNIQKLDPSAANQQLLSLPGVVKNSIQRQCQIAPRKGCVGESTEFMEAFWRKSSRSYGAAMVTGQILELELSNDPDLQKKVKHETTQNIPETSRNIEWMRECFKRY